MTIPHQQKGVSLLEVLIALVVIAVGLLGITALMVRANQAEMESYQRAQALLLVNDMANRLRANAVNKSCYVLEDFGIGYVGTDVDFEGTGCNGMADDDILEWHNLLLGAAETLAGDNIGAMLGARGCVTYDGGADTYTVTVVWQGLSETIASANTCAEDEYDVATMRRVATSTIRIGQLI